jgi:hypothetical protein
MLAISAPHAPSLSTWPPLHHFDHPTLLGSPSCWLGHNNGACQLRATIPRRLTHQTVHAAQSRRVLHSGGSFRCFATPLRHPHPRAHPKHELVCLDSRHDDSHPRSKHELVGVSTSRTTPHPRSKRESVGVLTFRTTPHPCSKRESVGVRLLTRRPTLAPNARCFDLLHSTENASSSPA